ncbi:MAG: hypothetical protein OEY34_08390 [Cyclobacteriaceae bacterium]|nr:hypothetical protein [Cyclobacteriaceae bacterium]
MSLITFVKISKISNLSDARYSAGMGVNQIGICANPSDKNYIDPELAKDIIQWISGPEIVLECTGFSNWESIGEKYSYSHVQIPISDYPLFNGKEIKLILEIAIEEVNQLIPSIMDDNRIEYFYVISTKKENTVEKYRDVLLSKSQNFPLVIGFGISPENILELVNSTDIYGIALDGKNELKPGLADYDHLADVLELLEE